MTPIPPLDVLKRIADTPPGQKIDFPEEHATGLLWRMAKAMVATHALVATIQAKDATLTFTTPTGLMEWDILMLNLGIDE